MAQARSHPYPDPDSGKQGGTATKIGKKTVDFRASSKPVTGANWIAVHFQGSAPEKMV